MKTIFVLGLLFVPFAVSAGVGPVKKTNSKPVMVTKSAKSGKEIVEVGYKSSERVSLEKQLLQIDSIKD